MKMPTIRAKTLAYVFLGLVLFVFVTIALLLSPLGVQLLSALANDQEGIKIELEGSFYSQLEIPSLEVKQESLELGLENGVLDIGLGCLFTAEVCIEQLSAESIDLALMPSESVQEPEQSENSYISLPVDVFVQDVSVKRLSIQQNNQPMLTITQASLSAEFTDKLTLHEASFASIDYFQLESQPTPEAQNQSQPKSEANWLQQLAEFEYSPITIPEVFIPLNAQVDSVSVETLCLHTGETLCTENTKLSASLIEQNLDARIDTVLQKQVASAINLRSKIDFSKRFAHDLALTVAPNPEFTSEQAKPISLAVVGDINSIDVKLDNDAQTVLTADIQAGLSENDLPLDLSVTSKELLKLNREWLPNNDIGLDTLALDVKGNLDNYSVTSNVSLQAPQQADIELNSSVSVNGKQLRPSTLSVSGGLGSAVVQVSAELTGQDQPALALTSDIALEHLMLDQLSPDLPTNINGKFNFNGKVLSDYLTAELQCDKLTGKLQEIAFSSQCDISVDERGVLDVKRFVVTQADNSIKAKGSLQLPGNINASLFEAEMSEYADATTSQFELALNIAALDKLYKQAAGKITGNINIESAGVLPKIDAELDLNQLAFEQWQLKRAKLFANVDLANNLQSSISLNVEHIGDGGDSALLDKLSLSLNGDKQNHQLQLQASNPEYSTKQTLSGGVVDNNDQLAWHGNWDRSSFTTPFDNFQLNESDDDNTSIVISQQQVSVAPRCWQTSANVSALCIEKAQYMNEVANYAVAINYDVFSPIKYFAPDILVQGTALPVNANVRGSYSQSGGMTAHVQSYVQDGIVVTPKYRVELAAIAANVRLLNNVVSTSVFAGSKEQGSVGLLSRLDLSQEQYAHSGQLNIQQLDLGVFQRFLPTVENLQGSLAANVGFSGTLEKPVLSGQVNIEDTEIAIDNYPYPISSFNQQLVIVDNVANINGEFELGDGGATYKADISFKDELMLEGELNGAGMQIAFDTYELIATPNLTFAVAPDNIRVHGDIVVPNATIKINELPKSAKSPSSDIFIVGQQQRPPAVPIGLDIDVKLVLDPRELERVTIEALDLEASLGGELNAIVKQTKRKGSDPSNPQYEPMQVLMYGDIRTLSGSYEAYGQNLQIQKGEIYFNGEPSLPQFSLEAIRNPLNTADNVIAGVRVSGNPVLPKIELFSEPTMIQARQLSYLLAGTDLDGGEGTSNDVMLVNTLVGFGIGKSEGGLNRFGKALGFDSLNVRAAGQGTDTQVQVTGRISDDIQLTYGVGLFDQVSEVILKYQLMQDLYIEARSGASSAVDLFYEFTRGKVADDKVVDQKTKPQQ